MRSSKRSRAPVRRRDLDYFARPRPTRRALAFAVSAAFTASPLAAFANPTGASVTAGSATFATSGSTLTISNTPGAVINWQQFSIQKDEVTRFLQQNASSSVLNRVVGQNPSLILGHLTSNGRVFLINPSGIAFGQGAMIDVAGFAASTLNLSNADFISGRMRFTGSGAEGKLTNAGTIRTAQGGHVYLIAPNVENEKSGVITSPKGEVVIAAGKTVELVNSRTPDIRVEFTAPQGEAVNAGEVIAASGSIGVYGNLVRNSGRVSASRAEVGDGGKIIFKATKDVTLEATSRVEASGATGGEIKVQAETGAALISSTVEAKGEQGKGGDVQLLGHFVGLVDNALVDASGAFGGGQVLVGGDFQGKNAEVQNAERTYVGRDAVIRANAGEEGDGGKVIVWADDATKFYGNVAARGGLRGGNGGFAEVSGEVYLDYRGRVDLRAPLGRMGELLLDPKDITIVNGADQVLVLTDILRSLGTPIEFLSQELVGAAAVLNDGTINQQLNTANVRVKTGGGGGGSGNIIFDTTTAAIDLGPANGTATGSLTFDASGAISFIGGRSTAVNLHGGQLTLRAGGGTITQTPDLSANNSTLDLTSTALLMIADQGIGTSSSAPLITTGVTSLAAKTLTSGGIFIQNGGSDVSLASLSTNDLSGLLATRSADGLSSQGGSIWLQNSGDITSNTGAPISTSGAGNVTITSTGSGIQLNETVSLGSGLLTIDAASNVILNGAIATAGGDVAITAGTSVTANSTITTTAATNSGVKSGDVSITAGSDIVISDTIDTSGASRNAATASQAGAVSLTTGGGNLQINGDILAVGGAGTAGSASGGDGGGITLNSESGTIENPGILDARGGAPDSGGTAGQGGAIRINNTAATPGDVVLRNAVTTNDNDIEIAGRTVSQNSGAPIATSGVGAVSITSTAFGVTLDDTVSLDRGQLTIDAGAVLNLNSALTTQGGDVLITTGDINVAVTSSITTTAAADSGVRSGDVSITATTGDIALQSAIVTTGASNSSGTGSAAGAVSITADNGFVTLTAGGGVFAQGGAGTAGNNGGAGAAVSLNATGSVEVAAAIDARGGAGSGAGIGGAVRINDTSPAPNSVTVHSTGSIATNDAIIDIRGVNVTIQSSVTNAGTGTILVDAGAGTLTNESTITNTVGTGAITLAADRMALENGTVVGGSGIVTLRQSTNNRSIDVGTVGDTQPRVELSEAELNTISTTGTLRIGDANTQFFNLTDSVDITSASTVRLQASGSVWSNGFTIGAAELALVSNGGGIDVITATSKVAAQTSGGGISIVNTSGGALNVGAVDGISGLAAGVSAITLTETDGHVTLSQAVSGTSVAITLNGDDKLLTNSNIITATGAVALTADKMALGGSVSAAGQTVTLRSKQNGDSISVGVTGDTTANTLELSDAELDTISAASVAVGVAIQTGGIAVGGDFSTASANLTLSTDGAITRTAGTLSTGGAGNLTLNAVSGIGTLVSPILIGNVGGSLGATNTASGALALNITSDALTVGAGGGINQFAGGSIRLDQTASVVGGGTMTIAGNITAGAGGSIILNADGVLTRTAGTLTADTIELGTAGTTTQIGAALSPILLQNAAGDASPTVVAQLSATGTQIALEQTAGPLTTASYTLITPVGTAQNVLLATTDGDLTINGAVGGFGTGSAGTTGDAITLDANGTTRNIAGTQGIAANALTLSASGAIGSSGSAIATAVASLAVSAGTGGVFISEADGISVSGSTTGALNLSAGGTVSTGGALSGADVALTGAGGINIGHTVTATGSLGLSSSNAAIGQSSVGATIFAGGITTVNAGTGDIGLDVPSNNFVGAVNLTGGTTTIRDAGALTLGTLLTGNLTVQSNGLLNLGQGTVAGTLSATSGGNHVTQAGALAVTGGPAAINAGTTGDITLNNTSNNFSSVTLTGKDVSLTDANALTATATASGALTLSTVTGVLTTGGALSGVDVALTGVGGISLGHNVTATGTLGLTSSNNTIGQSSGVVAISATGATTVNAGATGDVSLDALSNNFVGAVNLTGGTATIRDAGVLTLGTLSTGNLTVVSGGALGLGQGTVGGTLSANSAGNDVTQSGGLTVTFGATINAGTTGDIGLADTANNFSSVTLTGRNVSLTDSNALTATATANGTLTLIAGAGGAGALTTGGLLSGTNVALAGAGGINIGHAVTATGTLGLTSSNNAIGQTSGGATITAAGITTVNAGTGDIGLDVPSNNFGGAVSLTGGNVSVRDTNDLTVSAFTHNGANKFVVLIADGQLTLPAQNIDTGAAMLQLRSQGGTLTTPGNLTGGNVTLVGRDGLTLANNVSAGGTLVLGTTDSPITQTAASTITVVGTTTASAGAGAITLAQPNNDFQGAVTLSSTGSAVSIRDTNDLILAVPTLGADTGITAIAGGTLTLPAMDFSTGTGNIDFQSNGGALATTGTLTTTSGTINLAGSAGLTVSHNITSSSGDVTLSGGGITIGAALATAGGDVAINSTGGVSGTAAGSITTMAAADTATASGSVTIDAAGNVSLSGAIATKGADDTLGGTAADAGAVTVTSTGGAVALAGIDASGGDAAALGTGGLGAAITIDAATTTTLNGALLAEGGTAAPGIVPTANGAAIRVNTGAGTGGGLTTVNAAVTTNNADIDLRGTGVTLAGTSSVSDRGTGVISVNAADGMLTNAGAITNSGAATDVTLLGDKMALDGGTVNGGSGNVIVRQATNGTAIDLGSASDTGFGLSEAELDTITTSGVLRIGDANSGAVAISASVGTANVSTTRLTGSGISGAGTFTETSLALVAGSGGISVSTAADNLAASAAAGGVTISNTAAGTLAVTTVDATVSGISSGGTAISLTETTGSVTLSQAVNAGASTVAITLNGDDKLLTNSATLTGTGGVTLTADKMALGGSTVATGATVTLGSKQATDALRVGVAGDATANALELSDAELDTIMAATVAVGTAAQTGGIVVGGNFDTAAADLALTTGGAITRTAGALGTGGTGNLTLNAVAGIGNISGPTAPVVIGAVGGNLSATNTTSGDLYLSTGAITVGAAGVTLQQQANLGHLRIDSSGGIAVGGNLTSGTSGNGTITLNPTGTLTRTAGTLTANAINLGTNNNATAIGTAIAPILVAGGTTSPTVTAQATTGGIFLNQSSGDILTSGYRLSAAGVGQALELATTDGKITIDHTYTTHWNANTQDDNVSLVARGAGKNIVGGGGTLATSGNVTLDASGGIGVGTAVNTSTSAGDLNLTTAGVGAAGDITLVEANALNTNRVFLTADASMQSVSLTSTAGPITLGANIGNATDDLALTATAGSIVSGAGIATANVLSLNAAASIGASTETVVLRAAAGSNIDIAEATAVQLGNGVSGVTSSGGSITITTTSGSITTGNSVTTTGGNGSISLFSGGTGGIALGHDVSANGAGDVRLLTGGAVSQSGGAITADALGVRAQDGVDLAQSGNNVATLAISNAASGAVSYSDTNSFVIDTVATLGTFSTVDGVSNPGRNVTLLAASGAVTQTAGKDLTANGLELRGAGSYTLTNTGNNVATIAASAPGGVSYTDSNALAVGTVNGTVGMTVAGNIQLTTLGAGPLTVDNDISTSAGGTVTLTNAGVLGLNANIGADGAVAQNGAGSVTVAGIGTRTITTTDDDVSFATAVTLASPLSIDTGAGAGNITFSSTLTGGQNLTLTAGTGNVTFTGAVGLPARLGAIQINSANNVTANTISAASLVQSAGTGLTDLNGALNTNGAAGVALTTNNINVDGGITTTGGGAVAFTNAGTLSLSSDLVASGAVTQNGAGAVTIGGGPGTRTILTDDADVSFATAVTLNAGLSIDTDTGPGDITFGSALSGAQAVTLTAGSGDISVTGNVGIASLRVVSSTTATFDGKVATSGSVTLDSTAGAVSFLNGLDTGAASSFGNTGILQIGDNAADTSSIHTSLIHAGPTTLAGAITIAAPAPASVQLGATTIAANTVLTAAGGTADFGNVSGPGGLTVTAGDTTFGGTVSTGFLTVDGGGTTRINGGSVITTNGQSYVDAVTIDGATILTSGAGANIAFTSSLTGLAGPYDLSVTSAGAFSVGGALTGIDGLNVNAGGDVTLANPGNIIAGLATFTTTGSGSVDYYDSNAITLGASSIAGSARIVSGDGGIAVTGAVSTGGGIALVANDGVTGGNSGTITIGASLTTHGQTTLNAADDILVNGQITTNGGNIDIVAGNSAGVDYATVRLPAGSVAAREAGTGDNFGAVHFTQRVDAGTGNIVLVTAGDATTVAQESNVTQSSTGELVSANLTVVTLKGPGGLSGPVPGGDIILNTSPNNDNASVRFFACQSAGCPTPALTNPTVPVITAPGFAYGAGQIAYSGLNGVNLNGLGTVGDFYSFVSGPFTLTANPFSAGNVTIESDDDIIIDLGQNLLKISNDPASTLAFKAKGNIRYVNAAYGAAGGGGTIGEADHPFDNHLNMTAAKSILLENHLYQNTQNLLLAANTGFDSVFQPSPVLPSGTGDVTLQGNYTVSTGGNVMVKGRNFSLLGGDMGGEFQAPTGQSLIARGAVTLQNTGWIKIKAGTAVTATGTSSDPTDYPSGSGALLQGSTVNIGSAATPTANPTLLIVEGGNNLVGYASASTNAEQILSRQANAIVRSTGAMNIHLREESAANTAALVTVPALNEPFSLVVRGGTAMAENTGSLPLYAMALGALQADTLTLQTGGAIVFQGGSSELRTANALAASSAQLLVSSEKTITAGGSVVLIGGSTKVFDTDSFSGLAMTSADAANATALARLDPSKLTMTVDGILVLQGGKATGPAGSLASARIDAGDEIRITVNGSGPYTYQPSTGGTSLIGPASFFMIGGSDSGFFDANNVNLASSLPYPQSFPITINLAGGYLRQADAGLAGSVVQTGLATFDDSLLSYTIFAANEETRAARIRRGLESDDIGAPACR